MQFRARDQDPSSTSLCRSPHPPPSLVPKILVENKELKCRDVRPILCWHRPNTEQSSPAVQQQWRGPDNVCSTASGACLRRKWSQRYEKLGNTNQKSPYTWYHGPWHCHHGVTAMPQCRGGRPQSEVTAASQLTWGLPQQTHGVRVSAPPSIRIS